MDIQYFGGNCLTFTTKDLRVVLDDNLAELGLPTVTRAGDILLFTGPHQVVPVQPKLLIDQPGEYEVSNLSIVGIPIRGHMDPSGSRHNVIYKLIADDVNYLLTGHIYPDLSDQQLEAIGVVDVMCVPVGGNGYTLDAIGVLQLIKKVEPKVVIPTHYADSAIHYPVEQQSLDQVLKNLSMEPKETVAKLRYKAGESSGVTQLVVLTRS